MDPRLKDDASRVRGKTKGMLAKLDNLEKESKIFSQRDAGGTSDKDDAKKDSLAIEQAKKTAIRKYIEAKDAFNKKAREKSISPNKLALCKDALAKLEGLRVTEFSCQDGGLSSGTHKQTHFNTAQERKFVDGIHENPDLDAILQVAKQSGQELKHAAAVNQHAQRLMREAMIGENAAALNQLHHMAGGEVSSVRDSKNQNSRLARAQQKTEEASAVLAANLKLVASNITDSQGNPLDLDEIDQKAKALEEGARRFKNLTTGKSDSTDSKIHGPKAEDMNDDPNPGTKQSWGDWCASCCGLFSTNKSYPAAVLATPSRSVESAKAPLLSKRGKS